MSVIVRRQAATTGAGGGIRSLVAIVIALATTMLAVAAATPVAAQDTPGTSAIEVHVSACPPGYDGESAFDDCHANGMTGVGVSIAGPTNDAKTTEGGTGAVRFANIPAGSYSLALDLPDDGQTYRTYCSIEGEDTRIPLAPENAMPSSLVVAEEQAVICDIHVIPPASDAPAEVPAQVTINPVVCPEGTDAAGGFDALSAACTQPVENVTFTWGDASGVLETFAVGDGIDQVDIAGISPGTYTLYSDIPLEFAAEALYCVADGGDRYQKTFSDIGVTTFTDIQSEEIACDWFILPLDLQDGPVVTPTPGDPDPTQPPTGEDPPRGVETGASLVVHLALCPVDYDGDDLYGDCHGEGISDQEFVLTGPDGEARATTTVPQTPGPGIVEFTELPAGDYTLMGGPPGDFGSVSLYCTTQPDGTRIDAPIESTVATFSLGEGEDVLCDWYYIPQNQGGPTETPTAPAPERAEILVTLYACAPGESMAGAGYDDLTNSCTTTVDGVSFSLGDPGAPPLAANTGVSGPGAVRFYDLLPADYTLSPDLPDGYANAAVHCRIDGGESYQKTISNGATTFVNVDGEAITCDWFVTQAAPPAPRPTGPDGSITVREFLCEDDASQIDDWEQACRAGTSGTTFTLASTTGDITRTSATNADGVAIFDALPDGFFTLEQNTGAWCKARAERVDSQSRVIVEGGQNTDVFIYQCDQVTDLPSTGTGPLIAPLDADAPDWWTTVSAVQVALMGVGVLGAMLLMAWAVGRRLR